MKRFTKDSKYCKTTEKDFAKAIENICYSIGDCILAPSQKHEIPDAVLLERKNKLMELVNNRNATVKTQNSDNHRTLTSSFKKLLLKNSIHHIHHQLVVDPIDKANGKVAFTCKDFFYRSE